MLKRGRERERERDTRDTDREPARWWIRDPSGVTSRARGRPGMSIGVRFEVEKSDFPQNVSNTQFLRAKQKSFDTGIQRGDGSVTHLE